MKTLKFTVILSFPFAPALTGIALVHASNTLGAEAYAVALFPEDQTQHAKISAIFPGWHFAQRSPNSFAISTRSYPVPLGGYAPEMKLDFTRPEPIPPGHQRQGQPTLEDGE